MWQQLLLLAADGGAGGAGELAGDLLLMAINHSSPTLTDESSDEWARVNVLQT